MSDTIFAGGTVVTAEASFRADVAVDGETIAAVGVDLPRDGAEVVDVSGALLMPGFIDGHTHMDMPFGGTVTADDWDTGTAAALAGGTTTLVDFSLQDVEGTLAEARRDLAGQGRGQGAHRLRPARRDHEPHRGRQERAAVAARARRRDDQDLHGLQGHAALHGRRGPVRGDADRARVRAARARARRERRRDRQAPGAGARARRRRAALARADAARGRRGRGDEPRDPARRGRRLRRCSSSTSPAPPRSRRSERAHARGRPVYAETCPQYLVFSDADLARPGFEGAKYVLSPPLRDPSNRRGAVARPAGRRPADLRLRPLLVQLRRPEGAGPRRLHADPERRARRRGAPGGAVDARRARGTDQREPVRRRARHQPGEGARDGRPQGRARARAPTPTSSSGTPT